MAVFDTTRPDEHFNSRATHASLLTAPAGTESTDFDLHESKQFLEYVTRMDKMQRKLKGGIRWILLCAVGMMTGIVGVTIDKAVEGFFDLRFAIENHLQQRGNSLFTCYLAYVGFCLGLAAVAGFLVCYVEPLAAGSGIPEVKCYLNGVHLPRVVDFKTLVAKAPGVMFSVSAGMPCGKEGPMIHSGAIIGGVLAKTGAGPLLRAYRADVETRDFVAAGASSGVAAAFGAPLGGVLFAMEEGATFFTPVIMLRTFVCCTSAALVVRFLLTGFRGEAPWGTMGAAAPLSFGSFGASEYKIWELPIFALIGAAGGLCGAAFNAVNTRLTRWRMRHVGPKGHRRYLEVLIVTATITTIMFFVPVLYSGHANASNFSSTAKLFRNAGTTNIGALFHQAEDFDIGLLCVFATLYYMLACWCYGLGLPSGLFVPSLLTGAAFGRAVGQCLKEPLGLHYRDLKTSDPGVYALMGATALLSGMARITISLAVILMEASGSVQWALPIFVTTMCSKWAGDVFTIGLYDIHIELKHVPLLEASPEKEMLTLQARSVMTRSVTTFKTVETVQSILSVLEACNHNGFPVLWNDGSFAGLVKRGTLIQVLWRGRAHQVFQDPTQELSNPAPFVPYKDERHVHTTEDIFDVLEPEDLEQKIDLTPYMNRGCYTVPEFAALTRVYKLFRGMGLRHLPVVGRSGKLRGMITRKDLILADERAAEHVGASSMLRASEINDSLVRQASR